MTTLTQTAAPTRMHLTSMRPSQHLPGLFGRPILFVLGAEKRYREAHALRGTSDAHLKDMGISRTEAATFFKV